MRDASVEKTTYFYTRHPISLDIILHKLKQLRGSIESVRPDELFDFDQDHYGGLAANDRLAREAMISSGSLVADFCAGLGGTARYFAHQFGAEVTGIELTPARVQGGNELTRLVGLQDRVRILEGNVHAVPLPDGCVDAVVSQEAFCHVPDRAKAIGEAFRVLRPGGRLAMTDWIRHGDLADDERELLWEGMAIQPLETLGSYRQVAERAGFRVLSGEDLTAEWAPILRERLRMYQELRREAEDAGAPAGHDAFHRSYVLFVDLVQKAQIGGIRLVAEKPV
jgi:ubiquinone/menaquinone biosynthesis C-methylase UbiE